MGNSFENLYNRQTEKQASLYERLGRDTVTDVGRDHIVLENLDHAIEEIVEARREIHVRKSWNPNKADLHMSGEEREKCTEEIIDVLHFLFTACIYLDNAFKDIEDALEKKMAINNVREDHKY